MGSKRDDDDVADFEEDLEFGKKWEQLVSSYLKKLLPKFSIDNVEYERRPELQRAGIDTILAQEQPTLDVKTNRNRYLGTGNLPIEIWSDHEAGVPGWFYTSEADLIVWVWENQAGTNCHHRGYFMPHSQELIEWANEKMDELPDWRRRTKQNESWETVFWLFPIDEFPDEFLVEFDPRPPNERETPQSDLSAWTDTDN